MRYVVDLHPHVAGRQAHALDSFWRFQVEARNVGEALAEARRLFREQDKATRLADVCRVTPIGETEFKVVSQAREAARYLVDLLSELDAAAHLSAIEERAIEEVKEATLDKFEESKDEQSQ